MRPVFFQNALAPWINFTKRHGLHASVFKANGETADAGE